MHTMDEDWNDVAQSERDEPKLITQIILIVVRCRYGNGFFLRYVIIHPVFVYIMWRCAKQYRSIFILLMEFR